MSIPKEKLLRAYRQMKTIREFEERAHAEIMNGQIAGFTHLYTGQEANAVGVCEHLDDLDTIISTHRGHGHCIVNHASPHHPSIIPSSPSISQSVSQTTRARSLSDMQLLADGGTLAPRCECESIDWLID